MSNEIKQGDKVRVSEDAPKILFNRSICNYPEYVFEVREVEDGYADIYYGAGEIPLAAFVIPCKYLVKVDAEAKEAKFKVGDKVKIVGGNPDFIGKVVEIEAVCSDGTVVVYLSNVGHSTYKKEYLELYTEPTTPTIKVGDRVRNVESGLIGVIDKIVCGNIAWVNGVDGKRYPWKSDWLELIEPTEQAEAEYTKTKGDTLTFPIAFDLNEALEGCDCLTSIREQMRKALREIKENNKPRYVPKIMFNTEFWVKYEADLAKEVVLKTVNSASDRRPSAIAEYAVSVAKAVVEGLKRK